MKRRRKRDICVLAFGCCCIVYFVFLYSVSVFALYCIVFVFVFVFYLWLYSSFIQIRMISFFLSTRAIFACVNPYLAIFRKWQWTAIFGEHFVGFNEAIILQAWKGFEALCERIIIRQLGDPRKNFVWTTSTRPSRRIARLSPFFKTAPCEYLW